MKLKNEKLVFLPFFHILPAFRLSYKPSNNLKYKIQIKYNFFEVSGSEVNQVGNDWCSKGCEVVVCLPIIYTKQQNKVMNNSNGCDMVRLYKNNKNNISCKK